METLIDVNLYTHCMYNLIERSQNELIRAKTKHYFRYNAQIKLNIK